MIITFLLGVVAGYFTATAEPHVRKVMENVALAKISIKETEFDLLTLLILLLIAAILVAIFNTGGGMFALLIGAIVGVFGKRIYAAMTGESNDTA